MDGVRHTRYGWWLEEAGPVEATAPLAGDTTADVVIAGGGYLGLWTAWQLKELEPSLDVVVLEAGLAGHGPSGRNGGFVSTLWDDLPILRDRVGDERALAVARASDRGVRGIGEWCERTGVDAWFRAAPTLYVATSEAQLGIVRRRDRGVRRPRRPRGDPPDRRRGAPRPLRRRLPRRRDPPDVRDRPPCPALARPSREGDRGGRPPPRADARPAARRPTRSRSRPLGRVRAGAAVLAVNSATVGFHGFRLAHAVASSHMVVTEPVPDVIEELGWTGGEAIADGRTLLHYLRTTRDGRIAFGWGGGRMGFGARQLAAARRRPRCRPHRPGRPAALLPAAPRTADHERLGRADRRLAHAPADLRQPRARPPRLRVHGERRRAVLPRRRDPRPARPRPPRRADPARDRRAVAEAHAARAVPLGRRLRDPRRARPVGRGRGRRAGAPTP